MAVDDVAWTSTTECTTSTITTTFTTFVFVYAWGLDDVAWGGDLWGVGILLIFPSQMILHIFAETPTVPLLRINDSYTQRDQNAHGVDASKYQHISTFFAFNDAFNASQCYIVFWKEGSLGLLLVQNSKTIAGVVLAITVLSVSVSFFSRNFIRHKRILSDSINEIALPPLQIRNILNGNVKI